MRTWLAPADTSGPSRSQFSASEVTPASSWMWGEIWIATGQCPLYGHHMLTITSRIDVMYRLGRAMADPTRSRILLSLLDGPGYPAKLAQNLGLTRTNVSNHLSCLRGCGIVVAEPEGRQTRYEIADPHLAAALTALVDVTLAVDESAPCADPECAVLGCCDGPGAPEA